MGIAPVLDSRREEVIEGAEEERAMHCKITPSVRRSAHCSIHENMCEQEEIVWVSTLEEVLEVGEGEAMVACVCGDHQRRSGG